jgi:hypothetical protein
MLADDAGRLGRITFKGGSVVGGELGTAIVALDSYSLAPRHSQPPTLCTVPINVAIEIDTA